MRVPRDLGPRTFGEVLDSSFLLYRRHFGLLALLTLIMGAASLVGAALTADYSGEALANYTRAAMQRPQDGSPEAFMAHWNNLMATVGDLQLAVFLQAIFQAVSRGGSLAAAAIVVSDLLAGAAVPTVGSVLRRALPRLPAAIMGPFVLQTVAGPLVCCLPLYVAFAALILAQPVIATLEIGRFETRVRAGVAEGRFASPVGKVFLHVVVIPLVAIVDSTMRCCALCWNLAVIGRGTALMMVLYGFGAALVAVLVSLISYFHATVEAAFWAQHYGELFVLPAYGIGITLWYADLLVRREGADLEQALAETRGGSALA